MTKDKPVIKDANDQLKEWSAKGVKASEQARQAEGWLKAAKPFIVHWANEIGEIRNLSEKTEALNDFFKNGVAVLSADDRAGFKDALLDALQIKSAQWTDRLRNLNGASKKKKDDEDDNEPIFTAGGWIQHHLVELFYKPDEMKTYLAVRYPDGQVSELMERVFIQGQKYLPIPVNSNIKKRTVRLPSELTELKSEDELLNMTRKQIATYFDFGGNDFFDELSPLYVPYSYQADGFMEVSYLRAHGDYGTAKTRFLKSVGLLCYRPIYMSGGSSAASIYTLLDTYHGTLVLNEGDFTNSDEASMIAKILNGGTERGESVTKMRGTMENMASESFDVFGCKVIATRKEFNDHAIKSRCLTMEMIPMTPREGIPFSLPAIKEIHDQELRNLWMMRRLNFAKENVTVDEREADRSIEPRLIQITLSLFATIQDENVKESIHRFLRKYSSVERGNRYEMFTARVLEGLVLAWAWDPVSDREEDLFRVYMKDIALGINQVMDHQKALLGEDDEEEEEAEKKNDNKKGDKMTPRKTKSRKVSDVFSKFLNLKTIRATDGIKEYKGTKYVDMAADQERVKALCTRWGVEWLERGCLGEKAKVDEENVWMKRPKFVTINFNVASEGIKKAREQWKNTELPPRGEDE